MTALARCQWHAATTSDSHQRPRSRVPPPDPFFLVPGPFFLTPGPWPLISSSWPLTPSSWPLAPSFCPLDSPSQHRYPLPYVDTPKGVRGIRAGPFGGKRWTGTKRTRFPRLRLVRCTPFLLPGASRSFWIVNTTMIYTHVLNRGPAGVGSPADGL